MRAEEKKLYLVIDPCATDVLEKVRQAIDGGVDILQVWNHWSAGMDKADFINRVCQLAQPRIPVLINEEWQLLPETGANGIHLDSLPPHLTRSSFSPDLNIGVTCGNDTAFIDRCLKWGVDYLSFCALFPSASAITCELVSFETITQTRAKTSMPIYVSGGITIQNIGEVLSLGIDGVAVISGILSSDDPARAANAYKQALALSSKSDK